MGTFDYCHSFLPSLAQQTMNRTEKYPSKTGAHLSTYQLAAIFHFLLRTVNGHAQCSHTFMNN